MMMDRKVLEHDLDMLQGNINRMCVTDDEEELINIQQWAKRRIDSIYLWNCRRLKDAGRNE